MPFGKRAAIERIFGAADFGFARQEDQNALAGFIQRRWTARAASCDNRLALGLVEIARFDREHPARRIDHRRAVKMGGDARRIERRRHHQNAQVFAQAPLHIERQGKPQIAIERTLMELVEDHEADAGEFRIALQPASKNAFGDHFDAGGGRHLAVEPDGIADRIADLLLQGFRHAPAAARAARRRGSSMTIFWPEAMDRREASAAPAWSCRPPARPPAARRSVSPAPR